MDETSRVVVGIDGSESSRDALRWALAEAIVHSVPVEVLHAWHSPLIIVPDSYDAELVERGRMDEAALRFIEHELDAVGVDGEWEVVIEKTAVNHNAARALIEASARAGLVVLGRHGVGGFPHELLAPKVVQVAHHAACPVAVVPDAWHGEGQGVVVGVDGSEPSIAALRWAAAEADQRNARLTAVMTWGLLDQRHAHPDDAYKPDYSETDARRVLDSVIADALGAAEAAVARCVVNDLPAQGLCESSAEAELLVVGSRGHGGFGDLLLGSVSHRCLTHASCPTVVVR